MAEQDVPTLTDSDVAGLVVGVLGGTGDQGRGLARRLAAAGNPVIIGSRSAQRAVAAAASLGGGPGGRGLADADTLDEIEGHLLESIQVGLQQGLTREQAESEALKRFGSVTVLNGHIHQVMQKVEGNVTFHSAMSTAFPQPAPGSAPSAGPMTVPAERLQQVLGVTSVNFAAGNHHLAAFSHTGSSKKPPNLA